jgi:hypothetical protein
VQDSSNSTPHFFVDLHCHPSIKAFARSFQNEAGVQSASPRDKSSIWRTDPPSLFDKLKNFAVGLTNFIQSDATSLLRGRVCVVCLSFYPQEKGFFVNKAGDGIVSDALTALATEFGQQRIDFLQGMESYWDDLRREMDFLRQRANNVVQIDGKKVTYTIACSYADIEAAEKTSELGETKIVFVPTIEGGHVFDQVMNNHEPWTSFPKGVADDRLQRMLARVHDLRTERAGCIRPFFITFAHHFWNGLCGQARSLTGFVKCVVDQENGLEAGFTEAGKAVVHAMLDELKDDEGKPVPPILIDVKHMNRQSRQTYFELLRSFAGSHPVIASHAGVTGLSAPDGKPCTQAAQEGLFMTDAINFYDDELLVIEETGGVFGIQLDERRIGSQQALRNARGHITRRDILYAWAGLVWNQVRHVAELLDMNGRFAWNIQCLGTDFDGIIDPINGYWTSKELDDLDDYLLKHAFNYLKGVKLPCPLQQERNKAITPEEVVDRVMTGNALNFLSRFYR